MNIMDNQRQEKRLCSQVSIINGLTVIQWGISSSHNIVHGNLRSIMHPWLRLHAKTRVRDLT